MVARCPVCDGSGRYTPPRDDRMTGVSPETVCHGCGGKGWVSDQVPPFPYVPPVVTPSVWPGCTWGTDRWGGPSIVYR